MREEGREGGEISGRNVSSREPCSWGFLSLWCPLRRAEQSRADTIWPAGMLLSVGWRVGGIEGVSCPAGGMGFS